MAPMLQQKLEQKLQLRMELRLELRQCLLLENAMNSRTRLPEEPPKHLEGIVNELKARFNYDYYSSDQKYLEKMVEMKDRGRMMGFLAHNRSIYSFGGLSDKAIDKISKLLCGDCPENIIYDYANLIVALDLLDKLNLARVPSKNFEKNFEKLRVKTLKEVAEFLEIEVPKTPKGEWDYSLLPMFIESVLHFNEEDEDDEYDDDGYGEGEEGEDDDSPSRKMSEKLRELDLKQKDLENFFDENAADANFDPADEGMEFRDDLQRYIDERKLGLDEKMDIAVESALNGRFEDYFMGDDSNQFARYNRNAVREMADHGLHPMRWLKNSMEDRFVLSRKDVMELLSPDQIIERSRRLVTLSLGSRKEDVQGYLVPGIIKRVWGTVHHAIGKMPPEISTLPEAKLFLKNLQANWRQANVHMPEAMATASMVGAETSALLKQLDASFSNREGGIITIKLWGRNVGTDVFIGNYAHCCVGVGECNQTSIYDWLALAPTNVITVNVQNERTGSKPRPVGAIFIGAFREGETARLLVDGIELDNMVASVPGLELRMRRFISEFAEHVGFKGSPLYSSRYVRLDMKGFSEARVRLDILGGFPTFEDELYFETYGGWTQSFDHEVRVFLEPGR